MKEFVFFLGMIILFVGIIAMFLNFTKPAHVAIVLGSITEFISAIFFYLYNKTVTNMWKYHDKFVIFQNITDSFEMIESIENVQKGWYKVWNN